MTIIGKKEQKVRVYKLEQECSFDCLEQYFDDFFEIDSRIGTIIMILNSKGYFTEMSCEEHFHDSIGCDVYPNDEIPNSTFAMEYTEEGIQCHYFNKRTIEKSFIRFMHSYNFSTLPVGWKMSNDTYLYFEYDCSLSEYDFYLEQAKALKKLYDWAKSLPNLVNCDGGQVVNLIQVVF